MRGLALLGAFFFGASLMGAPGAALAVDAGRTEADGARQILVGLDLSKSNPLITDAGYAARVAARLGEELDALPLRSRVMVRTFGVYDASSNHLKIDQVISARARPEDVAEGIQTLVANLPALVKEGKLEAQMKTNIVPFLDTMAQVVDCKAMPTTVVLLTDGAEDSDYGKLTKWGGKLPVPQEAHYEGCEELVILGLGQGFNSPKTTARFRTAWQAYAEGAGFKSFTGLYDW
ncbi:conserved protein [Tepidicaulis marinus]|uniref:Conserved protein n=1 Tax=Tepidicaulis marinus TaxID=1333998 RepID=A0A081B8V8_9HYPH|nr:hypothetical protein [Tepidicaulis marinus]GAK44476.1 conserved protein [Tepidicaulis marinus]